MATLTEHRGHHRFDRLCWSAQTLAADASLVIGEDTSLVFVSSTDANTKAATVSGGVKGQLARIMMSAYSGTGSYTVAAKMGATSVTVTLDAAGESVDLFYDGSDWQVSNLGGGATAA